MNKQAVIIHPLGNTTMSKIMEIVAKFGGTLEEKKTLGMKYLVASFEDSGLMTQALDELNKCDECSHAEIVTKNE